MPTYYREIEAMKPFPVDRDKRNRIMFVISVRCVCRPTTEFEEEMAQILVEANAVLFVRNESVFNGPDAPIPNGEGPYLTIENTGGPEGERTHNSVSVPAYEKPTAMLTIRAGNDIDRVPPGGYAAASAMADAAYLALVGVRNTTVTVV